MRRLLVFLVVLVSAAGARAEDLSAAARSEIDGKVTAILARTGAPSAAIAVVRDGAIAYERAYGTADLATRTAATPAMRYGIGSISKQFLAASVLLLAEEGRLSLDDKVVRWFPDLTRANEVSVRQLLAMTSGYRDYWPQDYVMPMMLEPATPDAILAAWAGRPVDFEPGTRYQYSNTNYVLAGRIVEKVSGMPLFEFFQKRIFAPLGLGPVLDIAVAPLSPRDAPRYHRYALGPARPAPAEGAGWLFGAGQLVMTARDLALWDAAMMERKLLRPESWNELMREVQIANGTGTQYGLGVGVAMVEGRRRISHGGEVSGFTAANHVYPDQLMAVVALVNLDATDAAGQIATSIAGSVFAASDPATASTLAKVEAIFSGLQKGAVDRALLSPNASFYFSEQALRDFAASLGPLGTPQEFAQTARGERGGMTLRRYRVKFPSRTLRLTTFILPDGRFEQLTVAAE